MSYFQALKTMLQTHSEGSHNTRYRRASGRVPFLFNPAANRVISTMHIAAKECKLEAMNEPTQDQISQWGRYMRSLQKTPPNLKIKECPNGCGESLGARAMRAHLPFCPLKSKRKIPLDT